MGDINPILNRIKASREHATRRDGPVSKCGNAHTWQPSRSVPGGEEEEARIIDRVTREIRRSFRRITMIRECRTCRNSTLRVLVKSSSGNGILDTVRTRFRNLQSRFLSSLPRRASRNAAVTMNSHKLSRMRFNRPSWTSSHARAQNRESFFFSQ